MRVRHREIRSRCVDKPHLRINATLEKRQVLLQLTCAIASIVVRA